MAARLDDLLESRERVVYRARRSRSAARIVLITVFVVTVFWGLFIATSAPRVSWPFGASLAAALAAALSIWLQPGPIIVTDRRLLCDRGPWAAIWRSQRCFALPLAEVRGIKLGWGQALSLRLADGRVLALRNIANPKRLAGTLSTAR